MGKFGYANNNNVDIYSSNLREGTLKTLEYLLQFSDMVLYNHQFLLVNMVI